MKTKAKKTAKQRVYKKEHYSEKALKSHLKKIKARGGKAEVNHMTITYQFPS